MYAGQADAGGRGPAYKRVLNPNTMPWPGPGDIDALTETKTFSVTALNQSFSDQFTMPEGYSRIIAITFDPYVGAFVTLKTQRGKQDIMSGFNTLGIGQGIFPMGTKDLEDDVINYNMTFWSLGRVAAATVAPPEAPVLQTENQFPYSHSLTLIYGR